MARLFLSSARVGTFRGRLGALVGTFLGTFLLGTLFLGALLGTEPGDADEFFRGKRAFASGAQSHARDAHGAFVPSLPRLGLVTPPVFRPDARFFLIPAPVRGGDGGDGGGPSVLDEAAGERRRAPASSRASIAAACVREARWKAASRVSASVASQDSSARGSSRAARSSASRDVGRLRARASRPRMIGVRHHARLERGGGFAGVARGDQSGVGGEVQRNL